MRENKKYTLKQVREICENFGFIATEGIGGGQIEIAKYFDDEAFGVFMPIGNAYLFRFYRQ